MTSLSISISLVSTPQEAPQEVPKVVNEYAMVSFDVLGKKSNSQCHLVEKEIRELLLTNDKSSLVFENVVLARTTLTRNGEFLNHELKMISPFGQYTTEQFIAMMQFTPAISNEAWGKHLNSIAMQAHKKLKEHGLEEKKE